MLKQILGLAEQPPRDAILPAGPLDGGRDSAAASTLAAWRAVVDAMPDGAMVVTEDFMIRHHNQAVLEIFPAVRPSQPLNRVTRSPQVATALEEARTTHASVKVELVERVPLERRISVWVSPLALPEGQVNGVHFLLCFRDHSEQDKLEQMRADFVANASHELRTPLSSLRAFVDTLRGAAHDDAEARDRFLDIMATQAARMTRLIDDLLSLSRVEMRAHLPPKGTVDLNSVAKDIRQALAPLARSANQTITLRALDAPALIRADREEIVQVVQNLVDNAIKYGRDGGTVAVVIDRIEPGRLGGSAAVSLAVSDDGPGIAAQHLPRLVERFYRANVVSSRQKGGTGLGLAIVKHIVARHRGDLRIASTEGEGSTFTVVFDALRSADQQLS